MLIPIVQGGISVSAPVAVTFVTSVVSGSNTDPYTFSGASPAAGANDIVLVSVCSGSETRTINSVTVDGNAMTEVAASEGVVVLALYQYAGSTSGSGDIVVDFTAGQGRCGIGVYTLANASSTVSDTLTATASSGGISGTIDCPANGAVIGIGSARSGNDSDPAEFSWTLSTENFDQQIESGNDTSQTGAFEEFAAAQTNLTVTCTPNRSYVSNSGRLVAAAYAPA